MCIVCKPFTMQPLLTCSHRTQLHLPTSYTPQVTAEPAAFHFWNVNPNTYLVLIHVKSYFFPFEFHSPFNYYSSVALSEIASPVSPGWHEISLLWVPAVPYANFCCYQSSKALGMGLSKDGSFQRQRSYFISLCIIGNKTVFGIVVGILCRVVNWMTQ